VEAICKADMVQKSCGFRGKMGTQKLGHDRQPTSGRECRFSSAFSASTAKLDMLDLLATLLRRTMC
jgi:hypothetical protein